MLSKLTAIGADYLRDIGKLNLRSEGGFEGMLEGSQWIRERRAREILSQEDTYQRLCEWTLEKLTRACGTIEEGTKIPNWNTYRASGQGSLTVLLCGDYNRFDHHIRRDYQWGPRTTPCRKPERIDGFRDLAWLVDSLAHRRADFSAVTLALDSAYFERPSHPCLEKSTAEPLRVIYETTLPLSWREGQRETPIKTIITVTNGIFDRHRFDQVGETVALEIYARVDHSQERYRF